MEKSRILVIYSGIFVLNSLILSDAYAYIDPGSGSMIIQMIVGALVGVGITMKLYWHKIKYKFKEKFKSDK